MRPAILHGDDEDEDEDGDPEAPVSVRRCVDCHVDAPKTRTAHTLISSKHGWRLHRSRSDAGETILAWRCPTCWHKFKTREAW